MKPPDEFELSLPLLCLPLVIGMFAPGGDIDKFGLGPGEELPGDLDRGGAYLVEGLEEKGRAVGVLFDGEEIVCVVVFSDPVLVVIVRVLEVALAAVVDTCAVDTSEVGEITAEALDFAW